MARSGLQMELHSYLLNISNTTIDNSLLSIDYFPVKRVLVFDIRKVILKLWLLKFFITLPRNLSYIVPERSASFISMFYIIIQARFVEYFIDIHRGIFTEGAGSRWVTCLQIPKFPLTDDSWKVVIWIQLIIFFCSRLIPIFECVRSFRTGW